MYSIVQYRECRICQIILVQVWLAIQIYVYLCGYIYFHTVPCLYGFLSHNYWFYMASSVQLDFVADLAMRLYFHTAPVLCGFFPTIGLYGFSHTAGFCNADLIGYFYAAPGFGWLLSHGSWFCMASRNRILYSVISPISSRISKQAYEISNSW